MNLLEFVFFFPFFLFLQDFKMHCQQKYYGAVFFLTNVSNGFFFYFIRFLIGGQSWLGFHLMQHFLFDHESTQLLHYVQLLLECVFIGLSPHFFFKVSIIWLANYMTALSIKVEE